MLSCHLLGIFPLKLSMYKARCTVMGCCQKEGLDFKETFNETFSPTARFQTLRLLLAKAKEGAAQHLIAYKMDVETTFI
jgi:hypothetical protein